MDKEKALFYLENSFLLSLLNDSDVTDISYNGEYIYYVSNSLGRRKSDIEIDSQMAKDFIRQMANIAEKQFSFTNPNLDISVGKYRINATHNSICRVKDMGAISFSIRKASEAPRINKGDDFFGDEVIRELLLLITNNHLSLVIGGVTSSGKTELQKYLLRNLKDNERVIVIDNVMELEAVRSEKIDLTCWQVDEDNQNATPSSLIRNALRNNPDWLLLAEARGKEMVDVLNAAMTGLSIITTIHALDAEIMPFRMGRMMMQSEQKVIYEEALQDIFYHFHFHIYLTKEESDRVKRYISKIVFFDNKGKMNTLYSRRGEKKQFFPMPIEAKKLFKNKEASKEFKKVFGDINEE